MDQNNGPYHIQIAHVYDSLYITGNLYLAQVFLYVFPFICDAIYIFPTNHYTNVRLVLHSCFST